MENSCNSCELCQSRFQQVKTVGCIEEECELLIVGDYPKQEDDNSSYPFTGSQFQFLWELLNQIGVKYKVTYLIQCIPVDVSTRRYRKPYPSDYSTCMRENFWREVKRIKPKCLLVFGQNALEVFVGEGAKVADYRESVHEIYNQFDIESLTTIDMNPQEYSRSLEGIPSIKFLATYHPTYVLNSDNDLLYNRMIEDIVYACRHAMKHRSEGLYKTITLDASQFERVVDIWCNDLSIEYVSFDTETNGLNPLIPGAKITSFSVSVDESIGYNVFLYHPEIPDMKDTDRSRIIASAKRLLTEKKVVAHHAKHEHRYVKVCWGFTPNITEDTMYMSYILYLAYPGIKHGLKFLAGRFLAMPPWEEYIDQYVDVFSRLKRRKAISDDVADSLIEEYKGLDLKREDIYRFFEILKNPNYYIRQEESDDNDIFMWMVPKRVMEKYAGMDAIAPLKLMNVLKPQIESDAGLLTAYNMMVKGAEAFANMELKGLRIEDIDRWTTIYQEKIDETLEKLRNFKEVHEFELENETEFNPASNKHTVDVFFNKFKFPVKGTTGKGDPSTAETNIIALIKEYREIPGSEYQLEFLNTFRDYKKLKKLMTAYLVGLRRFIHYNDAFDGNDCTYLPVPEGNQEMHIHPGYTLHQVECLIAGTLVKTDKGLIPIESLHAGNINYKERSFYPVRDDILVFDGETYRKPKAFYYGGFRKVYKIETADGGSIVGTPEHPLYNRRGWIEIDDIKVGEELLKFDKDDNPYYSKVVSKCKAGEERVYDITMD